MHKLCIYIACISTVLALSAQTQQGKFFYSNDSSQIREIYHYQPSDSTLDGPYEAFYLNGSLKTFGWYTDNLPDSIWIYYYENGRKKAKGRYNNGIPDGSWKYYYENGNLKSEGFLSGNQKEGMWHFYFENDGEKSSGKYIHNEKTGIWNYFYEDGSLKAQAIIEEGRGRYTEFYPSGTRKMEGLHVHDKSEGEWIYYYETGEIEAIGYFSNGLKNGEWVYFHKNQEKAGTGTYKNGLRVGHWKYYHSNGTLSKSGSVVDDQKDGYWKLFYPTGELAGEAVYQQGSGNFTEYYPSGSRKSEGGIREGKRDGKWYYYNENGQVEGEANFLKDKGTYTGYYPDGTVKMKGDMEGEKRVGEWSLYHPDGSFAGTYRPIYEEHKPIFKTRVTSDREIKEQLDKPSYRPEKRGLRYFMPRVNEYKGIIVGTNPLWLVDHQIPIAVEYYMQERLGYEVQLDLIRDPFFISDGQIGDYEVYTRGARFHFRQKFYHPDTQLGMFYFGHEVNVKLLEQQVNHTDTLIIQQPARFGSLRETSAGYGVFIGNRWMKNVSAHGFTIDTFIGVGVALRSFNKNYEPNSVFSPYFDSEIKSTVHFPILFGINLGYALTKSKSKTQ